MKEGTCQRQVVRERRLAVAGCKRRRARIVGCIKMVLLVKYVCILEFVLYFARGRADAEASFTSIQTCR